MLLQLHLLSVPLLCFHSAFEGPLPLVLVLFSLDTLILGIDNDLPLPQLLLPSLFIPLLLLLFHFLPPQFLLQLYVLFLTEAPLDLIETNPIFVCDLLNLLSVLFVLPFLFLPFSFLLLSLQTVHEVGGVLAGLVVHYLQTLKQVDCFLVAFRDTDRERSVAFQIALKQHFLVQGPYQVLEDFQGRAVARREVQNVVACAFLSLLEVGLRGEQLLHDLELGFLGDHREHQRRVAFKLSDHGPCFHWADVEALLAGQVDLVGEAAR